MVPKPDTMQHQIASIIQKEAETDQAIARIEESVATLKSLVPVVEKHSDQIGHVVTYTEVLAESQKNANTQMAQMQGQLRSLEDKWIAFIQQNAADHASLAKDISGYRAEMLATVNASVAEARKVDASLQNQTSQVARQSQQETTQVYKTLTGASLQVIYILIGVVISAGGYILAHLIK